jgi:WD domain, G-beta repeat
MAEPSPPGGEEAGLPDSRGAGIFLNDAPEENWETISTSQLPPAGEGWGEGDPNGPSSTVWSIGADGEYIAAGTAANRVHLFHQSDLSECICVFAEPEQTVYGCALRGDWICGACGSGTIYVWSLAKALAEAEELRSQQVEDQGMIIVKNALLRRFHGHKGDVNAMRFVSDVHLISGSTDDTVKVWNVPELLASEEDQHKDESEVSFKPQEGTVWDVSSTGDGTVWTSSTDKTLAHFDWRTGAKLGKEIPAHKRWALCVAATEDYVVSGDEDKSVRVWSAKDHSMLHDITVDDSRGRGLCDIWSICATATYFLVGGSDGILRAYSYEDGSMLSEFVAGANEDPIHDIVVLNSSRIVLGLGSKLTLVSVGSSGFVKSARKRA